MWSPWAIRELLGNKPVTEVYEGYAGVVFNYIDAVKYDRGIDLAISVPNHGAIPGMEKDDVVEITCTIDHRGAVPMQFTKEEIDPVSLCADENHQTL